MKLDERIRARLTALIEKGEAVLATHTPEPPGVFGFPTLDTQRYAEWRSQALVCLTQVFGTTHTYGEGFQSATESRAGIRGALGRGWASFRRLKRTWSRGTLRLLKTWRLPRSSRTSLSRPSTC